MFGYIKPFKPQMRICEYDTYKAVYCGLCKQLGHSYGIAARFTLSYDFAFLSLLDMSLLDEPPKFCKERCFANPLKKRYCCKSDEASRLSACTAMVMLYYKVEDNYRDLGFLGKALMLFIKPFTSAALRKAKTEYPVLDEIVADILKKQLVFEENGKFWRASYVKETSVFTFDEISATDEAQPKEDTDDHTYMWLA
ncbi:MAG: DUF5685 family protein, partial [Hydrogenoanaerobacterium sp.]